ncbi:hypothetical protein B0T18DRAFT_423601 [Schizothecium vesticola]|uniref:Uncharacterized protein n=1 Tax=Schizothecium vesticola TaxID=314040 RepID=A0AA40F8D0_9PEZI|nr:hypothetical protein B0T18DRAFT_423601 [Schizothecium vesticola]
MVAHGAQVRRFTGDRESALSILSQFATKATVTLDIQRELVGERKELRDTAAGTAVNEELHLLEAKYREELEKLQQETAAALAEKDVELEKVLRAAQEKMERRLQRVHDDQAMFQAERREEIRRIQAQNQRRLHLLQREYDSKLQRERLQSSHERDEAQAALRDQMRRMELQNTAMSATFEQQMREMQDSNATLLERAQMAESAATSSVSAQSGGIGIGGRVANLAASGAIALADTIVGIPMALGSLFDLLNDL